MTTELFRKTFSLNQTTIWISSQ